ncbi:MAG: alpha-2-macroglobulin family protein, partial [Planctomycetota bacterium]
LRDGKGGFKRDTSGLHSFGHTSDDTIDAYITWAITEAAPDMVLEAELDNCERIGRESDDAYALALVAAALQNAKRTAATDVLAKLVAKQEANGSCMSSGSSITNSGGDNLRMETTAFATLAFLKDARYLANAEQAIRWMRRFGSTQATIMALKALVAYAKDHRRAEVDHDITVLVNGTVVHEQHLAAGTPGVLKLEGPIVRHAVEGANRVEIRTNGTETLPWSAAMTYRTALPPSDDACAVRVATTLSKTTVAEGETVACKVVVTNTRAESVPMTLARVGLPAGLEPRLEQLKELREQGVVGFYETREREVTLYWRGLRAGGDREITLDLVARIPGTFEGPATSAYLYYDDDKITWAAPLQVQITPAK